MSTPQYPRTVSARVKRERVDYIDRKAAQLGLTRAETLRKIIDFYRHVHDEGCPGCGSRLSIQT